jgi:hypothetical protein
MKKLSNLKRITKGKCIAYYGDSMTDGDFIIQDFRAEYQISLVVRALVCCDYGQPLLAAP